MIKNKAIVNEETTETVESMKEEIKKLRNALAVATGAFGSNSQGNTKNFNSSTNLSMSVNVNHNKNHPETTFQESMIKRSSEKYIAIENLGSSIQEPVHHKENHNLELSQI